MDEELLQKFVTFSRIADNQIAFSNPKDRDLWNEFIILAHKKNSGLTSHIIKRLLIEEEKWDEDAASEVASEFENYTLFLNQYKSTENELAAAKG